MHLRPSQGSALAAELYLVARRIRPHIVLLGGDLIDSTKVLPLLCHLITSLAGHSVVGAVSGNHDHLVGTSRLRDCVTRAGGIWLEDAPISWRRLTIVGKIEHAPREGLWALCGHYPTSFPAARRAGARLVMAGHLHGWQIVLGQRGDYLYPGALLSRWNGLRFEREGSTLLVSRGMSDLFPLRWNCPREVLDISL